MSEETKKVQCIGCARLAYEPVKLVHSQVDGRIQMPYCTGCMVIVDTMVERECLSYETYD